VDTLRLDIRYALRSLRRSKAFVAVAVLALALGIGANTAIFSVVDAVLLRSLAYQDPDRALVIWNSYPSSGPGHFSISAREFADLREMTHSFSGLSAFTDGSASVSGGDEPEQLQGIRTSPNLFEVLGVKAAVGRTFRPDEGQPGSDHVVLLSDALWRRRYGSDRRIVGETIRLDGTPYTVVGVMPAGVRFPDAASFLFPDLADFWVPRSWEEERTQSRGNQYLRVIGRLAPGVSMAAARADLAGVEKHWRADYPEHYPPNSGWRLDPVTLRDQMVGDVRPLLLVAAGAVGLVLLIACANVANLTLARASAAATDRAIRTALGAPRRRLLRQAITESTVLALCGGTAGLLLAWWGVDALVRLGPSSIPRLREAGIDGRVLLFSLALTLLTGVACGLAPALLERDDRLERSLRESTRTTGGSARLRARRALVVLELALALVVSVGAGLLLRSFVALGEVQPGFRGAAVLTMQITLPKNGYDTGERRLAFVQELLRHLNESPGVVAAAAVMPLPMSGNGWGASYVVEGQPVPPGGEYPHAEYAAISSGYFKALGIPLLAGRDFDDRDSYDAGEVVVVDEMLAQRHWPGENPIGKRLNLAGRPDSVWATVVGLVGHVHSGSLATVGEQQIYFPITQRRVPSFAIAIRSAGSPTALVATAREAVHSVDRDLPVSKILPMQALVRGDTSRQRFALMLISIFAATALLLGALGVYGVMSQGVAARHREMGIRVALGAVSGDIRSLVMREGLALAGIGVLVGSLIALVASRGVAGLLFGVRPADPLTYASIAALLMGVAGLAVWLPARRATRVDPMLVLRGE